MPLLQLLKTLLDNEQSEDRGADRAEKQRTADEGVFSGRKLRQRISAVRQQDYQSKIENVSTHGQSGLTLKISHAYAWREPCVSTDRDKHMRWL